MKLFKVSKRGEPTIYVPNDYSCSIKKDGRLEYFVNGVGYKKTKQYEYVDIDLGTIENLVDVARIAHEYGTDVAKNFVSVITGCCNLSAKEQVECLKIAYEFYWNTIDPRKIDKDVANSVWFFWGAFAKDVFEKKLAKLNKGKYKIIKVKENIGTDKNPLFLNVEKYIWLDDDYEISLKEFLTINYNIETYKLVSQWL